MIMKFPKGDITVDGNNILKDLRFNIAEDKRMRIKFSLTDEDKEIPIDLFVSEYYPPSISGFGVAVKAEGTELNTKTQFSLKTTYHIMSRKWKTIIKYGDVTLEETMNSLMDLLTIISKVILSK